MATDETHGLGYERVDDDPNVDVLLATMDATAGWEATHQLRRWERDHLALKAGQRLLDVGCGQGDAALALVEDLGSNGELVGIDSSTEMISAALTRASAAKCRTRFVVGDAVSLDEPDARFDAVRSERTLQWLNDPAAAVAEMVRVLRPGGLIALIDTDWSTFTLDIGDDDLAQRVRRTMQVERGRPSNIGRRLSELVRAAGVEVVAETKAVQTWKTWNPDQSPAPLGCFSMTSLGDNLIDAGELAPADRDSFVTTVHDSARAGRFAMALTMFAVVARVPS